MSSRCCVLALLVPVLAAQSPRTAAVTVSSVGGDRMAEKRPIRLTAGGDLSGAVIRLQRGTRFQTMQGFGATFTEAGSMVLNRLPARMQEETLRRIFGRGGGAAFTLMKSPAAAFDFAAAGPWYTYDDAPGDVQLQKFSIQRDLGPNGLLTYIRRAQRYGRFAIQSTTDYPPDWMLDDKMSLKPEYYGVFARYLARYLAEYEKHGVHIDYLAPFNEPEFIYCRIPYSEIGGLIKNHIGPELERAGLRTKLQVCESHNRNVGLENLPKILDDPDAARYIGTITVHGYDWERQTSEPLHRLRDRYPAIPIWQSEVCYATTIDKRPMPVHGFEDGDRWGRMIVADVQAGASGWIYWNLILDENGGPWLVSIRHYDPAENPQHPLVIIDGSKKEVEYTGAFWYLAHFSRFVPPEAVRIGSEGNIAGIAHVAFAVPDGTIVVQIVNSGRAQRIAVADGDISAAFDVAARSITTVRLH